MRRQNIDGALQAKLFDLSAVDSFTGCRVWLRQRDRDGYGCIKISGTPWRLHRLAWHIWRGPIPEGLHVCHHCDNPPCFNLAHLFLGTAAENTADKMRKGRYWRPVGSDCYNAKLTEERVRAIRKLRAAGVLVRRIAEMVGSNEKTVGNVLCGQTWKHVIA